MRITHLVAAFALTAACLPLAAQTLKPGLWQVTNKMSGNPELDKAMAEMQKQMASMPPEQRKQMEAMMAQQGVRMVPGAQGGAMAVQICMTKEMVERHEMPVQQQGDCKTTVNQRSGSTMKMAFTCTNPPSSGEGTFTYQGSEGYTSQMTMKTTEKGKTETMTMDGTGKWLSADCGTVKPMQVPKK
jgi:hypothetical protein